MNDAARAGGFAASDDGRQWVYAGTLTFANAETVLEGSRTLPLPSGGVADLSGLAHADSAALAVLLALRRRAEAEGTKLAFASVPDTLVSLARVYGIDALVGL
ncbi:MAG: STAS domain-containing protein [Betaproteobacteria bacterium]